MRSILLILGALVVLGGGAAGAYFYFTQVAEASSVEKFDEHADSGHGAEAAPAVYFEMDPLILPIVDARGLSQTVSLVVMLEVPDDAAKEKAQSVAPKLKDAFIQDLYGMLNRHAALKGGVLQVGVLKKRLNRISTKVLGEENVNDVLLQVVQQRPI